MLVGSKVRLRSVEPTDYPILARWLNDSGVMVYWGRPGNTESLAAVRSHEEANSARTNSRKYMIDTEAGETIGQIDYYDLDWQARSAWVSIMIGDPAYWSGGYGSDAMRTLLRYLFSQLGLHRIVLTVHETNERAIRSYRRSGFVEEGVLRDWAYFNGRWTNGVIMSVLKDDFLALPGEAPAKGT